MCANMDVHLLQNSQFSFRKVASLDLLLRLTLKANDKIFLLWKRLPLVNRFLIFRRPIITTDIHFHANSIEAHPTISGVPDSP